MTSIPPQHRRTNASGLDRALDWLQRHGRAVAIGAVTLLAVAALVLVYQRMNAAERLQAEQAYFTAQGVPVAEERERALDNVITRYDGTPGATQAAMMLAQLRYDRGAYAEGVAALERVQSAAGAEQRAELHALTAAGLEGQGSFGDAAARYRQAADAARFDADRDAYLADAARSYRAAGNEAEAVRIWTRLAEDPFGAAAGEARVRLGETTAAAAGAQG